MEEQYADVNPSIRADYLGAKAHCEGQPLFFDTVPECVNKTLREMWKLRELEQKYGGN
jgi:hypothetical protein